MLRAMGYGAVVTACLVIVSGGLMVLAETAMALFGNALGALIYIIVLIFSVTSASIYFWDTIDHRGQP